MSPIEPTEATTFSLYGLTAFEVQYWTGSAWATVPGGSVTGNNKVWKKITFAPLATMKIRVYITATPDGWSRLVEVEAWTPGVQPNVALTANGATATASSTWSNPPYSYLPSSVNNGDHRGLNPGNNSNWASNGTSLPQWMEVAFASSKTINEIDVFSLQDNYMNPIEPTETTTFSLYGLTAFEVQYWTGSAWATVPGGSVSSNNKVWKKITFAPLTTTKIRVYITATSDAWSRLVEVEAWTAATANINWLVTDHLGTPRMIVDETGNLANVKRHDYLPFGEELMSGIGTRGPSLGYGTGDGVRQQFTSKERDVETGLDWFGPSRYYSSSQGRFTSVDPLFFQKEMLIDPQRYNHYSYVRNNPLKYVDPKGEAIELVGDEEHRKIILEQLRKAVGQKAGAALYENAVTDKNGKTRYFVGIQGKAEDFGKINSLAQGIGAIIRDNRVAQVSVVADGTKVQGYRSSERVRITGNEDQWGVDPRPGITFTSGYGETKTFFLDPNAKYPHLPAMFMEDYKGAFDVAASDVLAHELGHVAAEWGLIVGDSAHISVAFENEARRIRNPNAMLRTGDRQTGDARPDNWKLGIKWPD